MMTKNKQATCIMETVILHQIPKHRIYDVVEETNDKIRLNLDMSGIGWVPKENFEIKEEINLYHVSKASFIELRNGYRFRIDTIQPCLKLCDPAISYFEITIWIFGERKILEYKPDGTFNSELPGNRDYDIVKILINNYKEKK